MPVLFSVSPIDPDSSTRVTLRFCNTDDPRVTGLNDLRWWPGVGRAPVLNREAFNGSFADGVAVPNGIMTLFLDALRRMDAMAPYYRYAGAQVAVWYGPAGGTWTDYQQLFTGLVSDHTLENGELRLTCTVDSEPFEADLLSLKYGGGGGKDGTDDLKGKPKPMCFGVAQNVEPVNINTVDNVFQVHGYGPIEDIPMVYERALEFGASQGDFDTYEDLVAADIDEGDWGTCLAEGMFRLGAPPFGLITADVKGDNTGGFHRTTAAIIRRCCSIAAVDPARLDTASLDAFELDCPEPINIYMDSSRVLLDLCQELALPCNAQASLSWVGLLQITRFGALPTVATMTLDAQGRQLPPVLDNSEMNVSPPYWRIELEADPCWRVHSKDEIVFEDEFGQVTVYRRYPKKPPTPTGDGIPEGWSATPPTGYAPAENVDGFDQFGPVWQSISFQALHGKIDENGWSEPALFDVGYQGWNLVSQNTGAKVSGNVNGLKASDDFDPELDVWPYCFINGAIAGPWHLKCRVKGSADRVAIGVLPYDPAVLDGAFTANDFKNGFYVAQADEYPAQFAAAMTGVFIYQEYDPTCDLIDPSKATMLDAPLANCDFEMVFNGETIEHWVNGERLRTQCINPSFETLDTYWAVLMPLSAGAEITDIVWNRATPARELDFRVEDQFGPLRRTKDKNGWELYAPHITSGSGAGELISYGFRGGAFVTAKIDSVSGAASSNRLELIGMGHFVFFSDGTFEGYRGNDLSASGTWDAGDEFGIKCDRKHTWLYQNGAQLRRREARMLDPNPALNVEFGAGGAFSDITLQAEGEADDVVKASSSNTGLVSPISDTTTTITGGWIVLGETPDVVFSSDDSDTIKTVANISYTKTAGAAANLTPQLQLQESNDKGVTYHNVGTAQTGPASTGTTEQVSATYTASVGGDGTRRYRALVKNLTPGAYTATISGTLVAEWIG